MGGGGVRVTLKIRDTVSVILNPQINSRCDGFLRFLDSLKSQCNIW